jgi:hypothetical protein
MNPDRIISFLVDSDWLFLASWVLVLGAAFVLSFPERSPVPERALSAKTSRR